MNVIILFAVLLSFSSFSNAESNCTTNEYNIELCTFDPDTVHFIDSYRLSNGNYNYLFRGNMPKNSDNQFAWDELKQVMTQKAAESNVVLPQTYYLIDFSFLVFVEYADLQIEQNFFASNPNLGDVFNYPLMGMCSMSGQYLPDSVRVPMSQTLVDWTWDDLPILVNTIRGYLTSYGNLPIVIYIHCEAGKDRTGEVSGSYYLQYLKWDFDQVVQYNYDSYPERQISPDMLNGLQWFCYYLHDTLNYDVNCDLPANFSPY